MGLKCGLKRPINKFDVYIDVHKYMRKLSIKKHILNRNSYPTNPGSVRSGVVNSGLVGKKLFNPSNTASHLEVSSFQRPGTVSSQEES